RLGRRGRRQGVLPAGELAPHSTDRPLIAAAGPQNASVRVSAKVDYALRAVIELAAAGDGPVKGERIAQAQEIPLKFLENILGELPDAVADLVRDPDAWLPH